MLTRRAALLSLLATPLLAAPAAAKPRLVFASAGVAIRGVDTVAYFREGEMVAGSHAEAVVWRGAIWCFANRANREAFERNPKAFAPSYGGYCALALSNGTLTPSDPAAWSIEEGRLFLNHSDVARSVWLQDPAHHVARADLNWRRMVWG